MAGAKLHINADSSKAQKELLSFKKKTNALTKSIAKGFTERIGHKLFDGLKAAVADIPRLAMDAVNAASDMNEELSKSEAVFDASAKAVTEWSKTTTQAFGISRVEALRASAEMGNMLRAFNIGSNEASTMSMRLVELAGDFASFNNASIEDTLYAIGAALRGENEPIKKYIGNISQATIQSKALELGLYSGKGAIDANAKALAVYNIILDSSERQIGDAAKTSKNLAGQKRILTAQIKDLQAEIGEKLLPTFTELVTKMNDTDFDQLAKDIGGLASAFIDVGEAIVKGGQGWAEFIRGFEKAETPEFFDNLDKLGFIIPQFKNLGSVFKGVQAFKGLGKGGQVGEDEMMDIDGMKKDEAWDKDFEEDWEKEKEKRKKKVAVDAANAAEAAAKAAADAIAAEKKRLELLEEQKKEREAIAAAAKAQQQIDDRMGQIGGVQASLQNAMTRSSISAVSSMQSIGGGGGVYGELDMMKTQVDLQEKLVILNEELCELTRQQVEQGKDGVAQY